MKKKTTEKIWISTDCNAARLAKYHHKDEIPCCGSARDGRPYTLLGYESKITRHCERECLDKLHASHRELHALYIALAMSLYVSVRRRDVS